ncbi:MAG: HAD hydrolase-like protein [Luteitalea sp.]|nr:HAD hydrolase-like protein [Luteitalea sp.]
MCRPCRADGGSGDEPVKLLLFDIDGTLITTGGAGVRAMMRALRTVSEVPDGIGRVALAKRAREVALAGRTDSIILRDLLAPGAEALDTMLLARIREAYSTFLREELSASNGGPGVLPGVRSLLDALADRDDVTLGLLTGNFPEAAEIKLDFYELGHHFGWGAFGDDAYDRNDLLAVALERYRLRAAAPIDPADVLIIGDTPRDVACAHAGGALAISVATGIYSADELRACGADTVLDDLTDTGSFLALIPPSP